MSAPDPADVLVAGAPDRLALIDMRGDAEAALALCRELHDHRADVRVALRCDGSGVGPAPQGRAMPAKYPSRCAVCATAISVGEPIHYDSSAKKASHARCA